MLVAARLRHVSATYQGTPEKNVRNQFDTTFGFYRLKRIVEHIACPGGIILRTAFFEFFTQCGMSCLDSVPCQFTATVVY